LDDSDDALVEKKGKPIGRKMEKGKLKAKADDDQLTAQFSKFVKSKETVMAKHLEIKTAIVEKKHILKEASVRWFGFLMSES
jgi:hypothetical protein